MNYSVETTTRFDKEFKKLDSYTKRMIKAWIEKNLIGCTDPRQHGKGLTANRSGQWRYRIGDYRLICQIEDDRSTRACDGSPAVKELLRHILAAFRYSTVPLTSGALGAAPALRRRERSNQRSLLTPRLSASLALKGARTGGSAKKSNQRAALDRSSGSSGRSAGAALSFCIFES